ncbi:MAG TPA: hypothetical protein IAC67_04460 [Candidatus Coproplasma excrementipullorum]|nr:hypothetical protein [Candidatus Coproplasma excrementipullorum]
MNLVFFDIECASVHKTIAKICAFGYVVCDEQFNIIKKEDILINPKGGFHLTDRRGEKGLELPYDYAEFKKHPPFPAVYSFIKELLEDKNNLVFGHAILNDVKYLDLETRRFHLPSFNFRFLDSQIMYMTHVNDFSRQFGLEYITENLNVVFTPHRAADDAYATMKIVEELCRIRGVGPLDLAADLGIKLGKIRDHNIVKPTSSAFEKHVKDREAAREMRSRNRTKFYIYLSRRKRKKGGRLYGEVFTFSRNLEDDVDQSIPLVGAIYEEGGVYSQKLNDCTIYVCDDDDGTVRTKNARQLGDMRIITPAELKEMFN